MSQGSATRRAVVRLRRWSLFHCVEPPPGRDLQGLRALIATTVPLTLRLLIAQQAPANSCQFRQRNPAHDRLCLSSLAEPNRLVCSRCSEGRGRSKRFPHLGTADAAIPRARIERTTFLALDSVLQYSA